MLSRRSAPGRLGVPLCLCLMGLGLLGIGLAPPVLAKSPAPAPAPAQRVSHQPLNQQAATPPPAVAAHDTAALSRYLIGSSLFALYHETAHALIDLMALPVLAQEEDAADTFATLMLLQQPAPARHHLITAIADYLTLRHGLQDPRSGQAPYWSRHALDLQRSYRILCLYVGSSPDGLEELADRMDMPPALRADCADRYQSARDNWARVLATQVDPGIAQTFHVQLGMPKDARSRSARDFLMASELLTVAAEQLNRALALPHQVAIRAENCGSANAHYRPGHRDIILCYELIGHHADVYLAAMTNQND